MLLYKIQEKSRPLSNLEVDENKKPRPADKSTIDPLTFPIYRTEVSSNYSSAQDPDMRPQQTIRRRNAGLLAVCLPILSSKLDGMTLARQLWRSRRALTGY
jgi:hypothetical protein